MMNRNDAYQDAIYKEVEAMVLPILRANARRFARQLGLSHDEAMQEARYGLLLGLQRYDYNDSKGGIYNFVKTVVRRHFLKVWAEYRAQSRRPHLQIIDENGKRVCLPGKFYRDRPRARNDRRTKPRSSDFLDTLESSIPAPDAVIMELESGLRARTFQEALGQVLSERDRQVLECKCDPPRGLRMIMLDELATEPTIPMIGQFLGLSKNEIDWALRRIRDAALVLIGREFSDLTDFSVVRAYVERHL